MGRAARHPDGRVIMYADQVTRSMRTALDETERRRGIQTAYNEAHGIEPIGIRKEIRDITDAFRVEEDEAAYGVDASEMPRDELLRMVKQLEGQMKTAARELEFERAAQIRDQVVELRRELVGDAPEGLREFDRPARAPRAGRGGGRGPARRRGLTLPLVAPPLVAASQAATRGAPVRDCEARDTTDPASCGVCVFQRAWSLPSVPCGCGGGRPRLPGRSYPMYPPARRCALGRVVQAR